MNSARRGYTLIEIMVASIVTSMIGVALASFVTAFHESVRIQEVRAGAILRSAGIQAHLSKLTLQSRMTLTQEDQRVLLWLPSENLEQSGSGAEAAFDRVNLGQDELYWLDFVQQIDGSWSLTETVVDAAALTPGETDAYFTDQAEYWNNLRTVLGDAGKLKTYPVVERIAGMRRSSDGMTASAPRFIYDAAEICENRHVGVEFAFVEPRASGGDPGEEAMRIDMRVDAILPFPDPHPICEE